MLLFTTRSAQHLAQNIPLPLGACTIKTFSDGELSVRVDQGVHGKEVLVLASMQSPAENIMELLFLLNALQRAGANIHLCITYFAYARNIVAEPNESFAAQVICQMLNQVKCASLYVMHPHSTRLRNFISFNSLLDINFFCGIAQNYDAIAAPDEGASELAQRIAQTCNKDLVLLNKVRVDDIAVEIALVKGNAHQKKILLVDDLISTGSTMIKAADVLKEQGALIIGAAATHGIFSTDADKKLQQSTLENIYVTNTLAQSSCGKIKVYDSSEFIAQVIYKINTT